jgi:hypothetical protein
MYYDSASDSGTQSDDDSSSSSGSSGSSASDIGDELSAVVDDSALLSAIGQHFALKNTTPIANAIKAASGSHWDVYLADIGHLLSVAQLH